MFRDLYAQIRAQITVARVAAVATVLAAPIVGWLATQLALLGFNPDQAQLTVVFVAGVVTVISAGLKWLDGRAKYEVAAVIEGVPVDEPAPDTEDRELEDELAADLEPDDAAEPVPQPGQLEP